MHRRVGKVINSIDLAIFGRQNTDDEGMARGRRRYRHAHCYFVQSSTDENIVRFLERTPVMLMRNPEYHVCVEQEIQSPSVTTSLSGTDSPRESYSQREMLLGHLVLLLSLVIAILLRSWGM